MTRNKFKRYTGAEVAQPKSIAEQLLAGTRIGNLLYGKQETYKDGNNQERKDASFDESANGQLVQRMGETAKDAGGLVATGLAFGNPLTASEVMAPLITGSQAYWIGHGINDGAQRIENIGEGVKNFVEDPSWQNAKTVAKEVPMLALDVAGAVPVARTVVKTGKNVIPAAQQAAQKVIGSVDNTITNATKQAVESGVVGVNELPAQLAVRATSTPKVQEPLPNVGWAPAQTIDIRRAGELTEMYYPNRWDVVEESANPFGVWLQGKFGTPRTDITNPGKGVRAAKARKLFENRPQYVGNVTFKKPIEVIGDVADRSALSYNAERMGADGIIYNGYYDNGYNNNQGIFSFVKPNLSPSGGKPARIMWMGPTAGKTTYAKKNLSVVDIDPLTKETRKAVAKDLGLDFRDPRVSESPEYQQAIVDMVNKWLKDPANHGKTLVASTKHLLDPKYKINFANEPFMPDFETFVTRNQARGFRETPEQLKVWYDNILKLKPDIKIDNRFASEILNVQ